MRARQQQALAGEVPSRQRQVRSAFSLGWLAVITGWVVGTWACPAAVVFEALTPYHYVRVLDEGGFRLLSFDGSSESRISLTNALQGHFEYTEYFHLPWLWHTQLTRVLMIGLGGGSTQQAYEHYCPGVRMETVELDPVVVRVARDYFGLKDSERQQVHVADGRVFLRRTRATYDAILVDAYVSGRYGSCIPYHLATKEFFGLARERLSTNGVLAYNVIGNARGWQAEIVGAVHQTLKAVFPQVYVFPAKASLNVVLVATQSPARADIGRLRERAELVVQSGRDTLPGLAERARMLQSEPPPGFAECPVLTDDFAPVDNLLRSGR
jgi:spermidine synthase